MKYVLIAWYSNQYMTYLIYRGEGPRFESVHAYSPVSLQLRRMRKRIQKRVWIQKSKNQ